ncbi:hypothetical protein GIB67_037165 [Kingdonia uniflora]|uniref:Uncharacterized protein n=1 Tax=Kingdonia uniflora TaxID=39325 RepID=A0A7J7MS17_9MAGN|nr:hypothetical protein GIB67_037165 [Kingdonia uniflora]
MMPSETDMQQDLIQEAMRYRIEAPAIGAPAIGSSSSATKIGAVVVKVCSQLEEHGKMLLKLDDHGKMLHTHGKMLERILMSTMGDSTLPLGDTPLLRHYQFSTPEKTQVAPEEIFEVVNALMVDDDVEVSREVNFKAISSEYGGDLLEWKKGEEKDNDDKKDVEEKVKSEEEEVHEMEESKNGDEKVDDVAEEENSEQPTVVVYYTGKKDVQPDNETMVVAEVAKNDIVFFNQEKVVGETYQASADQIIDVSVEDQTLEVEITGDEASQDEKNQVDQVWSLRKDELSPEAKKSNRSTYMMIGEETVCLSALYTLYPNQWLDNEVINVYIKAMIQYFDTQHRAHPENERIVLADIFVCQYISRAFNVWTRNMSSPKGVELKKKLIWEQITSMQWDRTFSNYIHRGDLKVVNSKLIPIPSNINDSH